MRYKHGDKGVEVVVDVGLGWCCGRVSILGPKHRRLQCHVEVIVAGSPQALERDAKKHVLTGYVSGSERFRSVCDPPKDL